MRTAPVPASWMMAGTSPAASYFTRARCSGAVVIGVAVGEADTPHPRRHPARPGSGGAGAQRPLHGDPPAFEEGELAAEDCLPGGVIELEMLPIAVFVGMLEFVEGIVLRVEQLPVTPHERLVEHWVFHGHPRVAAVPGLGRLRFQRGYRASGGLSPPGIPPKTKSNLTA